MEIWAVVVAGGTGSRFGRPKQLAQLGGSRVLDRSIDALRQPTAGIVVVGSNLGTAQSMGVSAVVPGAETRSGSVRNGLAAIPRSATHVLIHDAARPLVPAAVIDRVVAALAGGAEAVVPVIPVTDTLRSTTGGTVDRERLVAVQTPQGFDLATLTRAHGSGTEATDDAAVIEQLGVAVVHVDGSPRNIKITVPDDLLLAEALLANETDRVGIRAHVDRPLDAVSDAVPKTVAAREPGPGSEEVVEPAAEPADRGLR